MCGKDHMDVHLSFSAPFDGIVSSKGNVSPLVSNSRFHLSHKIIRTNRLVFLKQIAMIVRHLSLLLLLFFFFIAGIKLSNASISLFHYCCCCCCGCCCYLSHNRVPWRRPIMQVNTVIRDVFMFHRHRERHSMHFGQRMHDAVQNRI